jgi:hypothetical protein
MGVKGEWGSGGVGHGRLAAVLGDPQFWVPVIVLIAGLVVLRWIS